MLKLNQIAWALILLVSFPAAFAEGWETIEIPSNQSTVMGQQLQGYQTGLCIQSFA